MSNRTVWLIVVGGCVFTGAVLGAAIASVLPSTYRTPTTPKGATS